MLDVISMVRGCISIGYFLYLSNKLRMIMIVDRIRTMKNRTDDTAMREEVNEESELFIVSVVVLVGNSFMSSSIYPRSCR